MEGLELGELIGRGGYDRVYRGRWKGVLVAVKIVEHRAATQRADGTILKGDPQRESLLSSSMMHPNVVREGPCGSYVFLLFVMFSCFQR